MSQVLNSPRRITGFTLVEMIVVVAIVGVLAAAARPVLELQQRRLHEADLRLALRTLRSGIDAYKRAHDHGHIEKSADDSGYPPDLEVLVQGVPDLRATTPGKQIYFLRRLPRDPFANPSAPAGQSWALRSHGSPPDAPAPGRDVFDVASRSTRTALDGSRYADW